MKNPFGNMNNILKQAQAMQEQMARIQEQAASKTANGTAGGGIVTVTANGAMQIVGVPQELGRRRLQRFQLGADARGGFGHAAGERAHAVRVGAPLRRVAGRGLRRLELPRRPQGLRSRPGRTAPPAHRNG